MKVFAYIQLPLLLCLFLYLGVVNLSGTAAADINDFWMHALGYMVLMCSGVFAFPKREHIASLFIAFLSYSFFIECVQYFLPYRSFSWLDMLANGVGLIAGVCLSQWLLPVFLKLHRS